MTRPSTSRSALATLLCSVVLAATCSAAENDVYLEQLARYGIEPNPESLTAYFRSLTPSDSHQLVLQKLIGQLGDESYLARENATRELIRQPTGLSELLAAAIAGEDAEIRWRAKLVSDQTGRESQTLLHAALSTIQRQKLPGLFQPLLAVAPHCAAEPLRTALRRAVIVTLVSEDTDLLVATLQASSADLRALAAAALPVASGAAADRHLPALLKDESPLVRLATARALANRGQHESLPVLAELLGADDLAIRVDAIRTLKAATGNPLPFVVYDAPDKRAAQQAAWKAWTENEGRSATLKFPLRDTSIELGRLLVCDQQHGQLIEYDAQGKEIWKKATLAQPWGCQGLENGHRLVCSYTEKTVVEYDAAGNEAWRAGGLPGGPTSVQRLENGNTLLACTESSDVVEIDRAGKITWQAKVEGRPVDARRLDDGRTLVALQNSQKVVELDQTGKIVWELSGIGNAFSAQRLENGNTLVCTVSQSQVREYDRDGKIVWSEGKFQTPYTAQRLVNGNTMVVDRTGVHEIDRSGKEISLIATPRLSRAYKY